MQFYLLIQLIYINFPLQRQFVRKRDEAFCRIPTLWLDSTWHINASVFGRSVRSTHISKFV